MSDAQRHENDDPAAGGSGPGSPPPDETARISGTWPESGQPDEVTPGDEPTTVLPADGDRTVAIPPADADRTAAMPPVPPDDDRTSALPPYGGAEPVSPDDERTSVLPSYGGATPPQPPEDKTSVMPAQDVWTGRAGVPSREPAPMREATPPPPPGIEYGEGERTWLAPLLIGLLALVLLALFGVAAWFVLRDSGPAPVPSSSPTPAVTSAAPTSAAPSPSPSPSPVATEVAVPADLIGMTQQEAIDALTALGLNPSISLRQTDEGDPGTVVDVDPEPGTKLAPGETVEIVVAVAPPSPSPEPSPSVEPSPSPDED